MRSTGIDHSRIAICLLLVAPFLSTSTAAQRNGQQIKIQAIDGRNSRSIADAHLLVFAGDTAEAVRRHLKHFDLQTDNRGTAILDLPPGSINYVQVWVDGQILCQAHPNSTSLSVDEVLLRGLSAPNTCGSSNQVNRPGQLVIFARPSHWTEKMRW